MASTSFVQDTIRQANRNLITLCLIGLVIVVAGAAISYRYLLNFFSGPLVIPKQDVLRVADADQLTRYYVTVNADAAGGTGFDEIEHSTRSGSEKVTASFAALRLDRKYLLVKTSGDVKARQQTGALVDIPDDVQTQVLDALEQEVPELQGMFLPFMLDAGDFRSGGFLGLAVGGVVALLCVWGVNRAISRNQNPAKHRIMRALERFGPSEQIAEEINMQMSQDHTKLGKLHLLPRWLVITPGSSAMSATRWDDVVWIYEKVTQHRTNGIPTGKTFEAIIWDRHGVSLSAGGKQKEVDELLITVHGRVPWVVTGYSPDIDKLWKSDRATLLTAVEQRRQQVRASQPA